MLRSMTARQLQEWMAFFSLEPFGEDRNDLRFASVVQMIANVNRNSKKRPKPYTVQECALAGGDQTATAVKPKQDWRAMKAISAALTEASKVTQRKKKRVNQHRGSNR